jgi:hypothetical protein
MGYKVFISYSSRDKNIADAVCNHLEKASIPCWIAPRDIRPAEEWATAIVEGISTCEIFLLIFTGNSDASPQVIREVERAVNKGLVVMPIRIENVMPTKSMEYYLSAVHWLDAFIPPHSQYLDLITEKVKTALDSKSNLLTNDKWNPRAQKYSSGSYLSTGEIKSSDSDSLLFKSEIFGQAPFLILEQETKAAWMLGMVGAEGRWQYEFRGDDLSDGEVNVIRMAFTRNSFKFNSNFDFRQTAIRREFGEDAQHADFEHIRAYASLIGVPQFIDLLELRKVRNPEIPAYDGVDYWNQGPFVTYKGAVSEGTRAFFISVHDGVLIDDWRIVETIENHNIDLGSWHNNRPILVAISRKYTFRRQGKELFIS